MQNILFIGLGNMGLGMAINLVKAGHNVYAFDLKSEARAAAKAGGAHVDLTIPDALAQAKLVITMLPAAAHVAEILTGSASGSATGLFALAQPATLFVDCSTIDVASSRRLGDLAQAAGHGFVDAPVSGGVAAANAGTLTFMVGAKAEHFTLATPILQQMGKAVIHAGAVGSGQAAKICNNMLLGISMIGTCEAFALAEKLGLDAQVFFDISSKASGQNWSMTSYCPVPGPVPAAPSNRDYQPGFGAALMLKDLKLAMEAGAAVQAATPLGAAAEALYQLYVMNGGQDKDFSGIIQMLKGK